jgi:hypothetical protein
MLLVLCLVSLAGFAIVLLALATSQSGSAVLGSDRLWWLGITLVVTAFAWYRWPTRIVIARDAYAVYRFGVRLRVGPRGELSIRTKDFHGPRLNVSVYRRWDYEFWGIPHPADWAAIEALGCTGRI